jgi:PPOX class probable F420-dependent enzyme
MAESIAEILSTDWVVELLDRPTLARLGTANPSTGQPHVTPVWFLWDGECVYISVFSSTRKGKEVARNQRVSVLIDVDNPIKAVLFEGKAEVMSDPAVVAPIAERIYAKYVGADEVKNDPYQGWVHDPENRIIKLKPEKVFNWQ